MPHTFPHLIIHAIWSTLDCKPLILDSFEEKLHNHIKDNLKEHKCSAIAIGGFPNHLHLLFMQSSEITVSHVIKSIKGESSHWINQNKFISSQFAWQEGYAAFSVSESVLQKNIDYVLNQKLHHANRDFTEEYKLFLKKNGFKT